MLEAGAGGRAAVLRRRVRPSRRAGRSRCRPTMCRGPTRTATVRGHHHPRHQDVTEQRVAERALQESEARFRRIANSAPAMMWVTRLDRVRDFVNDAYAEFVVRAGLRPRGGADARLAHAHPSRRRRPDRRREHRRRGVAASRSRSRGATGATTASIAGCAACRSRASGRTASWSGSSASASDITLAKEAELELRRQVEEQTARAGRVARRSSARCSKRRSR